MMLGSTEIVLDVCEGCMVGIDCRSLRIQRLSLVGAKHLHENDGTAHAFRQLRGDEVAIELVAVGTYKIARIGGRC